jgi:hypothetical protein
MLGKRKYIVPDGTEVASDTLNRRGDQGVSRRDSDFFTTFLNERTGEEARSRQKCRERKGSPGREGNLRSPNFLLCIVV